MTQLIAFLLGFALVNADAAPLIAADAFLHDRGLVFIADPIRMRIPSIQVSAFVEHVGLDGNGTMMPPGSWFHVGWFRFGPRPGVPGNAVLAGHLDSVEGRAIFWDLAKASFGDTIEIVDSLLQVHTFEIESNIRYPASDVPMEELFSTGSTARIRLITCEGDWDATRSTYDERMVVTARYVGTRGTATWLSSGLRANGIRALPENIGASSKAERGNTRTAAG